MIRRYATAGLACSEAAAASLYGAGWRRDARWRLLSYGIDLAPFRGTGDRAAARLDVGIPADAFVVGNIGRFAAQKNHAFFATVAAEIVRRESSAHFLVVGDGPLRNDVERQIADAGLTSRFHIVSGRTDVAAFTRAMDVFLFPSVYEGLGIVLLEAQASGLPCVLTDSLPFEVNVVPALLQRVSLMSPPAVWADAVLAARAVAIDRTEALRAVERSAFNIEESCRLLEVFYEEQTGSRASLLLPADAAS
jgi:glycosyltransferase involved in cell wall biosynthesis